MNNSRLLEKKIISHQIHFEKNIKANRNEPVAPRLRDPIVSFCVDDLRRFFKMVGAHGQYVQSKLMDCSPAYIARILKEPLKTEINDVLGTKLQIYLNEIYGFLPMDLPTQITNYLMENHTETDLTDDVIKMMLPTHFDVKRLDDPLYISQIRELIKLSELKPQEVVDIYSQGEVPENHESIKIVSFSRLIYTKIERSEAYKEEYKLSEDKAFRFWFAMGLHLGLVHKREVLDKLNQFDKPNVIDFEQMRNRIHLG